MNNNKFQKIPPFKMWSLTNFPFIEADFDALSNYGLLCKIVEYINKVIRKNVDDIGNNQNDLQNQMNNIQDWFANLDVQDEINNKLDEMAESGELQAIIETFLNTNAIFGFNDIEEMKNSNSLIVGTHAKTYGYNNIYDGGGADYIIQENYGDIQLNNGLYAKKIDDDCEFVFPGNWTGVSSGSCILIKVAGKNILIDTHQGANYDRVKNMLNEHGVTHIDIFILTHFDYDHRANAVSLVNDGYIDSNTIYYHHNISTQYTDENSRTWYNTFEQLCIENNIQSVIPRK